MEIERVPVTLKQRIEYLNQTAGHNELNKRSFPWTMVIISLVTGAVLSVVIIYYRHMRKEKAAIPS
jgi:hypothetical protein